MTTLDRELLRQHVEELRGRAQAHALWVAMTADQPGCALTHIHAVAQRDRATRLAELIQSVIP